MKKLYASVLAIVLAVGCVSAVKPLSPGVKACGASSDCPAGYRCGFPGVNTHPQCLPQ